MPGEIPDSRFRLPHTFSVQPELVADEGPNRSVIIGRHSQSASLPAIYLGKQAETPHRNVWMDARGAHVLYVMGKRRSGKSYTLGAIAEALVSQNWVRQGEINQSIIILDTMNVFLTMPFSVDDTEPNDSPQVHELRKWRIEPELVTLSLFAPAGTHVPSALTAQTITLRASDLGPEEWCALFDVDPFVDAMGHLITTLLSKVAVEGIADRNSGKRIPPRDVFGLPDLTFALDADPDFDAFAGETRQALKRRFNALAKTALFGSGGLDIRQLLAPSRISILLLRDLEAEMRSVMVSLIVKKLMLLRAVSEQHERLIPVHLARAEKLAPRDPSGAAAERAKAQECASHATPGAPRTWLIIDEAHNYIPARASVPSKKPLIKYVNEGRNLGLSIVVATQQPSGLDPAIQRNADLLLIHALSHHDDISAAQGMINASIPDEITLDGKYRITGSRSFEALIRSLPLGYAIASSDRANRLFPICIRPRSSVHGGGDY